MLTYIYLPTGGSPSLSQTRLVKPPHCGEKANMKLDPRAATVHDVDDHDNPILHSKRSATRVKKETSPSAMRKSTVNHAIPPRGIIGESIISGPIEHMVKALGTHRSNPLTIFTRGQDQSREWNEIGGCRFRKVFFTGRVLLRWLPHW